MEKEHEEETTCPICMCSDSCPVVFSCSHSCCEICWTQIISAANSEFMVSDIKCFHLGCKQKITNLDEMVNLITDKDVVSRFNYLKKKQEIIHNQDKFLCPNKACHQIIDSNNQESARLNYKNTGTPSPKDQRASIKSIDDLDYSFLVCEHCNIVFCKICEIYHKQGEAACLNRRNSNSENILKVRI